MRIRIIDIHPNDAHAKAAGIVGLEGELLDVPEPSNIQDYGWWFLRMKTRRMEYCFLAVKYEQVQ